MGFLLDKRRKRKETFVFFFQCRIKEYASKKSLIASISDWLKMFNSSRDYYYFFPEKKGNFLLIEL